MQREVPWANTGGRQTADARLEHGVQAFHFDGRASYDRKILAGGVRSGPRRVTPVRRCFTEQQRRRAPYDPLKRLTM